MSNAPDAGAGQQDFIKGWPHPSYFEREELQKDIQEEKAPLRANLKLQFDEINITITNDDDLSL